MAQIVWSEPALADLEAIADYIALDDPEAAGRLIGRVVEHVGQLAEHPLSGSRLQELEDDRYRQIVEPPCRVIYRYESGKVHVVHVVRGERQLDERILRSRHEKDVT